jgi:hypothetical protein
MTTLKGVLAATVRGAGKVPASGLETGSLHQEMPSFAGRQHSHPSWRPQAMSGLEDGRLCCKVLVGMRADSTKELVAVADGQRESGIRGRSCCGTAAAGA